jgi:hypothetical protein
LATERDDACVVADHMYLLVGIDGGLGQRFDRGRTPDVGDLAEALDAV